LEKTNLSKTTNIGRSLKQAQQDELTKFLIDNWDIFARKPSHMLGIPREIAEHSLRIRADAKPIKQCLRWFDDGRRKAIEEEIAKLLDAGFIRELLHPDWLANPVLVPKKNKWRMCVDCTSLNKACLKDPYPLPCIDQIINSTTGLELLYFLDAYAGYNQIQMKESNQLATSLITPIGAYCYVTMPFELKNTGGYLPACHNHKREAYSAEVRKLEAKFDGLELRQIPQRDNEEANSLARIGST
jgi:hypothetical protein